MFKVFWYFLFLLTSVLVGLQFGATDFSLKDFFSEDAVIAELRLVRVTSALLVGFCLGLGGSVLQRLLQNPLADPYVLGISSGGTTAAVLYTLLGLPVFVGLFPVRMVVTLMGCLATLGILLALKNKIRTAESTYALAVLGLIFNAFFGAGILILFALGGQPNSAAAYRWLIGSLSEGTWSEVTPLVFVSALSALRLFAIHRSVNALAFGEEFARSLGFHTKNVQREALVWAALLIACSVSLAGSIGFVGLIVPHIARRLHGGRLKEQWYSSAIIGAGSLVLADTLARTWLAPTELPVGVFTAVIGVPALALLLLKDSSVAASHFHK